MILNDAVTYMYLDMWLWERGDRGSGGRKSPSGVQSMDTPEQGPGVNKMQTVVTAKGVQLRPQFFDR